MTNVPQIEVFMVHRDIAQAPRYALPAGYQMRFYHDGDVAIWVRVQERAERLFVPTAETFAQSIPGDTALLQTRVMFLVEPAGEDIGTITAWHSEFNGTPMGHIHWVAIVPAAQGLGLSKPMLSAALEVMRRRGDTAAWLETNTARVPALNLYLHFGFVPHPRNDEERAAWQAVSPMLKYQIQL